MIQQRQSSVLSPQSGIMMAGFPTTRWSQVRQAGGLADPESRAALTELCRAYWFPVYAYIRRKGHDVDSSADLTQEFFARLIEKGTLNEADPERGRFRAFLLSSCRYFLLDSFDRQNAVKRGGAIRFVPLEAEGRYLTEPIDELTPDKLFDRAWALSLLETVLDRLKAEYKDRGKAEAFETLKIVLTEGPRSVPQAELARRLKTTEAAVQVAVHRLRKRYKALVRDQIAATLADPEEVEDEILDLFRALG
jgi:RNA polymerase sigma factor (sigma-70 family)